MRSLINQKITHGLGVLFFVTGLIVAGQNAPSGASKLFIRYEIGAVLYQLDEDVLGLTLSVAPNDRERVAIRVCSREPLALSLPTASASPFAIANALSKKFAYSQNHIIYLRSQDCVSNRSPKIPITEVWAIPQSGSLPSYDEVALASQVTLTPLGKLTAYPGMRDYEVAISRLIKELTAKENSAGVVFGFFFRSPSPLLQRRLEDANRTLKNSGISQERYVVRSKLWDDESSPSDREPVYPSVFLVEIAEPSSPRSSAESNSNRPTD